MAVLLIKNRFCRHPYFVKALDWEWQDNKETLVVLTERHTKPERFYNVEWVQVL